jgi:hypothetical protein
MITYTGRRVDIPQPGPGQVTITDVATHLSRIPRFVGATQYPWCVAAHSLHCASLAEAERFPPEAQLAALLHDAHEAFCSDIPSPFKEAVFQRSGALSALRTTENLLQNAVLSQLGALQHLQTYAGQVKRWDLISLATERRDLMHPAASAEPWPWLQGVEPDGRPIPSLRGMSWVDWATDFEARYHQLRAQCNPTTTPETTTP